MVQSVSQRTFPRSRGSESGTSISGRLPGQRGFRLSVNTSGESGTMATRYSTIASPPRMDEGPGAVEFTRVEDGGDGRLGAGGLRDVA